ncbi:ParB/RepB/Spo0J family partition protein [Pelolinea submarina]|uniref:ParB family chromosome partitioning protein n=1 Tax=Pelolinea submarina TaxID=913107 RepID=A0A347ZSD3_9CHLR|nr:ParB/RepB/Spo0J family partition protein [Pelolinea submarina]REG11221.1 ParB family chromosome partitioning protein [Pelolinea submarina]BBB48214.1 chromosome partitioning protein, ParB family [Pelolinea submarina]
MARRGLGKGLDALIPVEAAVEPTSGAQQIPVDLIKPNPSQPRLEMDDVKLEELSNSIREHGIIQPLILTREPNQEEYILIAGERRLRAAKLAGLESVPAIVRQVSDQERLELALIENIQRENLTPLESAEAYQQLNDEFGLSHDQIAEQVGKSRTAVTNTIRLLKLPEAIRAAIGSGKISEGHGRALLSLNNEKAQLAAFQTIVSHELNVRQAEELVRKLAGEKPAVEQSKPSKDPEVKEIENNLRSILGTKVTLNHGKKGGTLVIHYYSDEELETLIQRFNQ